MRKLTNPEKEQIVRAAFAKRDEILSDCAGGIRCTNCPGKEHCATGCMRQSEAINQEHATASIGVSRADIDAAVTLLVCAATAGIEPFYADGTPTPNRELALKIAKALHGKGFEAFHAFMLDATPAPTQADAKAAERYRYLREDKGIRDCRPFIAISECGVISQWTGIFADQKVDAAIAATTAKGE